MGIMRNHTGTHLLHHALREVLGDHVKQQGSWVGPDRLRFDFSHYEALNPEEIRQIEDMVAAEVLANHETSHEEMALDRARELGAIAFFGDKYGDVVRVLKAGPNSIKTITGPRALCHIRDRPGMQLRSAQRWQARSRARQLRRRQIPTASLKHQLCRPWQGRRR